MGNHPPPPCQQPFTPCWCETRPNHPQCQTVPIDNNYFTIFSIVVILIVVFNKLNKL